MSVNVPGITEATGRNMVASLNKIAALLASGTTYDFSSYKKIQDMVKSGIAEYVLPVGSQLIIPWIDKATNTTYSVPFDVVHHGTATLADGEVVPAMYLQWHYATPFGVQLSNFQAFYYATAALAAGTYNVTLGTTWGKATSGKTYQFTLTKDLPIGGQLSGFEAMPDRDPSVWQVKAWASKTATTATETVAVSEGNSGTSLGTLKAGGDGTLNCMQRTGYGYNRWAHSAMRQWLNSNKAINLWWAPQNDFDRNPNELLTKHGFLTGFTDDFLNILTATKITTALNTVTDSSVGTTEDTYDKFFLASLQQMYINPQLADVEGTSWEYWKRVLGSSTPAAQFSTQPNYITYGIDNKTSAQTVRLRSAYRGIAYNTWFVSASGYITDYTAYYSNRCAPACAIC